MRNPNFKDVPLIILLKATEPLKATVKYFRTFEVRKKMPSDYRTIFPIYITEDLKSTHKHQLYYEGLF